MSRGMVLVLAALADLVLFFPLFFLLFQVLSWSVALLVTIFTYVILSVGMAFLGNHFGRRFK